MNKPEMVSDTRNRFDCVFIMPERQTKHSAGYDFYCPKDTVIPPDTSVVISTGFKVELEPEEVMQIHIRSSMAFKHKLLMVNSVGIIDADYYNNPDNEGEILIGLRNLGKEPVTIKQGERFAQGIVLPYRTWGDVPNRERKGGVGSSGR